MGETPAWACRVQAKGSAGLTDMLPGAGVSQGHPVGTRSREEGSGLHPSDQAHATETQKLHSSSALDW